MRKIYTLILGVILSTMAFSQPQFTANNCFQINDSASLGFVIVSQNMDTYVAQTGTDYTWDFTATGFPGPWGTWVAPTTPYLFQAASKSIHSVFHTSEINEYASLAFARDHFYRYSGAKDTLYCTGYYAGANYPYYTAVPYLSFPLSFADSVYTRTIQKTGNTVVGSSNRYWMYDGFGTIKFSYGTQGNVYRIRTKQIDSTIINGNFISANVAEEILWFRQSDGIPVLRFQRQGTTAISAYYASVSGTTGIAKPELPNTIQIYPNPANEYVAIQANGISLKCKNYVLTNQLGEQVLSGVFNPESTQINLGSLAPGLYFLQLDPSSKQVFKLVKN